MTTIILKQLALQLVQRLQQQQQAELNGHSIEPEIIATLTRVLMGESPKPHTKGLGTTIRQRFVHLGDFELPEVPREAIGNLSVE